MLYGGHTVADARISFETLVVHFFQHDGVIINIIVDTDFTLAFMQAMQPPDILCQRSMPGDRHRQEERIQAGIIKAFADELASCANYER